MWKFLKSRKFWTIFWGVCFGIATAVLITESLMPGDVSSEQSTAVGEVVNTIAGDQSEEIEPTSVSFNYEGSTTVEVGDTLNLSATVLPSDTSYASVTYSSSDENIASISSSGEASFISSGTVTFIVTSQYDSTLTDSIQFTVNDVYPESVTSYITSTTSTASLDTDEEGIYTLTENTTYRIYTTFLPTNTNIKDLSYEVESSNYDEYFSLSDNYISVLKGSDDLVFTIRISTANGLTNKVTFRTEELQSTTIDLEAISVSGYEDYTMSIGESINLKTSSILKVSYTPSNATYTDFTITSSNPNVVSVSGTTITGVSEGTSTITLTSTYYPEVLFSFDLNVDFIELQQFSIAVGDTSSYFTNKAYEVKILDYVPSNATAMNGDFRDYFEVTASPSEGVTIDNNNITFSNSGEYTVGVTYRHENVSCNATAGITVNEPQDVSDFEVNIDFNENNTLAENTNILTTNHDYDLSKYITFASFLDENNEIVSYSENYNTELQFYYNGDQIRTLNYEEPTERYIEIRVYPNNDDPEYYLSKIINIEVIDGLNNSDLKLGDDYYTYDFNSVVSVNNTTYRSLGTLDIDLYDTINVSYENEHNQKYQLDIIGSNEDIITLSSTTLTDTLTIGGDNEGTTYILFTPLSIEEQPLNYQYVLTINVNEVRATSLSLSFTDNTGNYLYFDKITENGEEIYLIGGTIYTDYPNQTPLYVGQTIEIQPTFDVDPTYSNVTYESSSDLITIDSPYITLNEAGISYVTITDSYSELSETIKIVATNKISLNTSSPFSLYEYSDYSSGTNTIPSTDEDGNYILDKGYSYILLVNYLDDSTYTTATYTSSDTDVLTIGDDGIISALEEGDAYITVTIDDGISEGYTFNVNLTVERITLSDVVENFFTLIRKSIGHFGAFACLGICSTLFFMIGFDKRYWWFVVPIDILSGLGIAAFTEICQSWVPNRGPAFSDVLIDFSGFITTALIIIVIFLIIELVKYIIRRNKNKKIENKDIEETENNN